MPESIMAARFHGRAPPPKLASPPAEDDEDEGADAAAPGGDDDELPRVLTSRELSQFRAARKPVYDDLKGAFY